ncbi:MAG: hypothetical protein ACOX7X_08285 [Methanosarcina flavescens]|jgi:hypothetical protein|uniref:Uncharacterized protein n=1 Tax=Methanosarcina flavescens TaxID=1715806 RepID=A0A660HTC9_9EURY|nr:hypothetical protein [Methanosarcina flavescens]AYK15409.1 hypothetical protein AOB57_009580 [Methanosarcina flavescens]NLK33793.1 hypothetical protein [Methanosarcina flavescens]
MTTAEETEKANLIKLKTVVEKIEETPDDKMLHTLIVELKNLSGKQYPVTDDAIREHFGFEPTKEIDEDTRKTCVYYTHHVLKEHINCGIKTIARIRGDSVIEGVSPDYSGTFKEVKRMITKTSLRAPKFIGNEGLLYNE